MRSDERPEKERSEFSNNVTELGANASYTTGSSLQSPLSGQRSAAFDHNSPRLVGLTLESQPTVLRLMNHVKNVCLGEVIGPEAASEWPYSYCEWYTLMEGR